MEKKDDDKLILKQKENKCAMYSDNIRVLYMTLLKEANVAEQLYN